MLKGPAGVDLSQYLVINSADIKEVDPEMIRRQAALGDTTVNRQVFESLKQYFSRWRLWDDSSDGKPPSLLAEGMREGGRNE